MMIGPSSGTSGGMPNRETTESSVVRAKRKFFDDLDLDHFCDDSCQSCNKRYHLTELSSNGIQGIYGGSSSTISSEKSVSPSVTYVPNAGISPMSSEEISSSGSMARLEVLVVDGNWDESSMSTNLTSLSSHHSNVINSSVLSDIQSLQDNYGTMPNWNTVNAPSANNVNQTPEVFVPQNMQPAEDQENGNLSWLLDFKLDSLIEVPEEKLSDLGSRENENGVSNVCSNRFTANKMSTGSPSSSGSVSSFVHEIRRPYTHAGLSSGSGNLHGHVQNETKSSSPNNYNAVNEARNLGTGRYGGPKKPPFTYTELIEHALQERGELTVSAIYQWISEHFPYYKSNDDRWKNSVRHNLSINPHFRKGSKAPHGAGHLWAIANRGETRPRQITPTSGGTLTRQFVAKNEQDNSYRKSSNNLRSQLINQVVTMDEIAAATASIQQPEETSEVINTVTLEHCAEQILSGIKREVEVQYLVPMVIPNNGEHNPIQQNQQNGQLEQHYHLKETDFLNPVSKEVVAEECGLIGEGYLVTDLNPTTLGLNMVESETITPENLFGEELSFQFYELTSPSQLQSA
ncbi:uncharacterized protein LOC124412706 [Diprion similis]|uniref:uncharacterized protein LOC124412706 n=1 Tax=Diprion similis TaxID=362088 RepID=UPI001EF8C22F|nr:uncharacterized protein LOC124412706 [Diprion similis]